MLKWIIIYCALWPCSEVQTITHVVKECTKTTFGTDIKNYIRAVVKR